MKKDYILKDLTKIGATNIIQKNSILKFSYSNINFLANFDDNSGYKLDFTYKSFNGKIALNIAGHNIIFTGDDVYNVLDRLRPIISPIFYTILDNLYIRNVNSHFEIDLHYTEYLFVDNYYCFYIFKQSFYEKLPKIINITASGPSSSLYDSIIFFKMNENDEIFYNVNDSIYATYFRKEFSEIDVGPISFSHCGDIFEVFDYVETLKELKHMATI